MPVESYQSNAMLNATFYTLFSEQFCGQNAAGKKQNAECCRIFGFDSPSHQFIFNAL